MFCALRDRVSRLTFCDHCGSVFSFMNCTYLMEWKNSQILSKQSWCCTVLMFISGLYPPIWINIHIYAELKFTDLPGLQLKKMVLENYYQQIHIVWSKNTQHQPKNLFYVKGLLRWTEFQPGAVQISFDVFGRPPDGGQPTSVRALPRLHAVDRSAVTQPKVGHVLPAAELQRSPL